LSGGSSDGHGRGPSTPAPVRSSLSPHRRSVEDHSDVFSDLLRTLSVLIEPDLLAKAVMIADKGNVDQLVAYPSGRTALRVQGSAPMPYLVLPEGRYCSCPDYARRAARRSPDFVCKHVLGARLATLLGAQRCVRVSDDSLARTLAFG
jgi:predicted nucleic acid-binding Zn finger protein